ncbi:hypothetical protein PINS_up019605 [Pythium insidiosum]|nr:hypothetical protein PINS_up019605 [Pythium insidiosum]
MLETKCTLSAAYSYVLKRRPLIFPNRGFMEQLLANERSLYGTESVQPQELDLFTTRSAAADGPQGLSAADIAIHVKLLLMTKTMRDQDTVDWYCIV